MALAVAALIYAGLQWRHRQHVAKVNEAFAAFEGAANGTNPSPEALRRVADEYSGVESVAELARITSADIFLDAVRMGVRTGAQINPDGSVGQVQPDGTVDSESELLSDEERGRYLDQAQALYGAVLDSTRDKPGKELLAINAGFGLAAVFETRGDLDGARAQLESVAALAEKQKLPAMARLARSRIDVLGEKTAPLIARSELPELPKPPEPDAANPDEAGLAPPPAEEGEPSPTPSDDVAPTGDDAGNDAGDVPPGDETGEAPAENPDQP